ncbi:hypothetical protein NM939_11875 [Pasteurella multocida]|nr:hypothetical protein [Pasteurella multocida]MDA5609132.1 hypothetical protein [Pasteurella multocida subsp. multocida]MDA5616670.1 hypothetical protein [Pasteurella multocida]MDA5626672.1 hypothetical protein [Pasteurella multocida]
MSTILLFNASNSSRSIHQNLLNAIAPLSNRAVKPRPLGRGYKV